MRLTVHVAGLTAGQQAPGFCAQKSSNCCASEPAGGAVSFDAESCCAGALAPPLSVPVVPVVPVVPEPALVLGVVPVEPDWLSGAVVPPGSAVAVGVGVGVASPLALLSPRELVSDGIVTSAGGPGTSW